VYFDGRNVVVIVLLEIGEFNAKEVSFMVGEGCWCDEGISANDQEITK
jgi:hypothetical protein